MNYGMVLQTKVGILTVIADEENLLEVSFGYSDTDYKSQANPIVIKASAQLAEYLSGGRKSFDLPLKTNGTELQEQVWAVLKAVPYGQTVTYKDISEKLGGDKTSQAIGGACRKNPLEIIIPSHRVLGSNGKVAGNAIEAPAKEAVLNIEKNNL
ncbi:MAG: methylated-DNA--[protein]-cysteine S-methyltransferase [Bacillota bacterium]|jgi:methylated-DNA-[protein]-cysteine S-methyltransferase